MRDRVVQTRKCGVGGISTRPCKNRKDGDLYTPLQKPQGRPPTGRGIPGFAENDLAQPWVDDRYREIFKVNQVASGQGGVARRHDTGDHSVAQFNWPALALPGGHKVGGLCCSFIIEWSHSMAHFFQKSFKRL